MFQQRIWQRGGLALAALAVAAGCATQAPEPKADRLPIAGPAPAPQGSEWIDLLAPEHAVHWRTLDAQDERFVIEDGVLHIPGGPNTKYIAYMAEAFGDFELHAEFKLTPGANSGIMFRASEADPVYKGMEIQVLDSYGKRPHHYGCGALYDVATPMFNPSQPPGEWNSYTLTCEGERIKLFFNGFLVLDVDTSKLTMPIGKFDTPYANLPGSGYLMVQDHGGEVWYRNLLVKKL